MYLQYVLDNIIQYFRTVTLAEILTKWYHMANLGNKMLY